jgi:hypothetical protein
MTALVGVIIRAMAKSKLSVRQERFCRLVGEGVPPYRAYPLAGYQGNSGSPYRLQENARVKHRISEIGHQMMRKTGITIETLLADLAADRELARELGQPSAAIAATHLTAKLCGLLVDRKEAGPPGSFSEPQTPEEVVAAIRQELGEEAADLLLAMLERPPAVA